MFAPSAPSEDTSIAANSSAPRASSIYGLKVLGLTTALCSLLIAYIVVLVVSASAVTLLSVRLMSTAPTFAEAMALSAGILVAALLTLVLGKGLFHRAHVDDTEFVELHREQEPELFSFIDDICARCDADNPDRVYACPNVNAGVFVETSLLRLFVRPKKHLLIGLGMINTLNRTEFEAVLAHEFGHFSQRSLLLHNYIQIMTGIFEELICGRDGIDRTVRHLEQRPLQGLGLAPLLSKTASVVHGTARLLLSQIRRLQASVSRQMELDADCIAVELTGSDALVHSLLRTDWANRCYSQTLYDLERAAHDGLRTDDVFYHQSHLIEAMRHRLEDPTRGIPPQLGEESDRYEPIFSDNDAVDDDSNESSSTGQALESHPSNGLREQMARRDYQRSEFDKRSAWSLFSRPQAIRATITDRLYESRWNTDRAASPAKLVQQHIDGEHAEVLLNSRDRDVYGRRFFESGELEEAIEIAANLDWSDDELGDRLNLLTGPDFAEATVRIARNTADAKAPPLSDLTPARPLRSPYITPHPSVLSPSTEESDRRWLADWDRRLLIANLCAAARIQTSKHNELVERYRFHLHIQNVVRFLRANSSILAQLVATVERGEFDEDTRGEIFSILELLYDELATGLQEAPPVPMLHGLPPQVTLSMLVLDQQLPERQYLEDEQLDPNWLQQFVDQWQLLAPRLDHLRRKSLGALLLYQRNIHRRFLDDTT